MGELSAITGYPIISNNNVIAVACANTPLLSSIMKHDSNGNSKHPYE